MAKSKKIVQILKNRNSFCQKIFYKISKIICFVKRFFCKTIALIDCSLSKAMENFPAIEFFSGVLNAKNFSCTKLENKFDEIKKFFRILLLNKAVNFSA